VEKFGIEYAIQTLKQTQKHSFMNMKRLTLATIALLATVSSFAQDDMYRGRDRGIYNNYNIISFAPIQITENGFGFGLSYEKFLDRSGLVSFSLPFMLTFNPSESGYYQTPTMDPMAYLQPGIKIYLNLDGYSRVKWTLGPNMIFGVGSGRLGHAYSSVYPNDPDARRSRLLMGAAATVTGNLFVSHYLYIGFDFSMGCSYLNTYDGINRGVVPLTQTAFRIGYRYGRNRHYAPAKNYQDNERHLE
jgi:hypothetical protein